jgi:hypothetical protein
MTLELRRVSTKVSRTSPAAVPAGTGVTAVEALEDSKVVAVPTWVMVVVVVAVDTSRGRARMPVATMMMAIDAPMMLHQKRERAGRPRRVRLLRLRRAMPSMLSYLSEPPRDLGHRSAGISVSFGAIGLVLH